MTPSVRTPAPADIIDRPDRPTSIVAPNQNLRTTIPLKRKWRHRQQPHSRLEPVDLLGAAGLTARWNRRSSRARVKGCPHCRCCRIWRSLPMTPYLRCPRPAPAPSPPPQPGEADVSIGADRRAPSSPPRSANNNSTKMRECRRRPAAAAPPSRPVQVGLPQSALESAPDRLSRAREGSEYDQRGDSPSVRDSRRRRSTNDPVPQCRRWPTAHSMKPPAFHQKEESAPAAGVGAGRGFTTPTDKESDREYAADRVIRISRLVDPLVQLRRGPARPAPDGLAAAQANCLDWDWVQGVRRSAGATAPVRAGYRQQESGYCEAVGAYRAL